MKREIKFRAWNKTHKWMDNEFSIHADGCIYQDARQRWDISDMAVETAYDELELMQFTGLKDKNGKEIYDGDLLRFPPTDKWDETNYSCFEVFFHDNDSCSYHIGWQMDRMHNHGSVGGGYIPSFKPSVVSQMVSIGNIYKNPELLK